MLCWPDARLRWHALPERSRRQWLAAAAVALHAQWRRGAEEDRMRLATLAFSPNGGAWTATFPPPSQGTVVSASSPSAIPSVLVSVLTEWHIQTRTLLTARDNLYFLRRVFAREQLDHAGRRRIGRNIQAWIERQMLLKVRAHYHRFLQAESRPKQDAPGLHGQWQPSLNVSATTLQSAMEAAEAALETQVIKHGAHTAVSRAQFLGRDTLIKRYDLSELGLRLKYLFRPSRARRAWAAAQTLRTMDISTPEPLGFLEIRKHGLPWRSYVLTAFLPAAQQARRWIKIHFHRLPLEIRRRFMDDLATALLNLYRNGIYHADTKSANILLQSPEDSEHRAFLWIDLECVQFGVRPSRHQIIRNLVQLNGSIGSKVSEEDRLYFLRRMSRHYPWLDRPEVIQQIRAWTRRRLMKELHEWCGS